MSRGLAPHAVRRRMNKEEYGDNGYGSTAGSGLVE